jgi:hypothetical protein
MTEKGWEQTEKFIAKTGVIVLGSTSGGKADYKPLVRRVLSMAEP